MNLQVLQFDPESTSSPLFHSNPHSPY
jgi:hypothetical protein